MLTTDGDRTIVVFVGPVVFDLVVVISLITIDGERTAAVSVGP